MSKDELQQLWDLPDTGPPPPLYAVYHAMYSFLCEKSRGNSAISLVPFLYFADIYALYIELMEEKPLLPKIALK